MGEVADAYRGCQERITSLARGLDANQAGLRVPTCPYWSVHDLVAHVSGVVDDVVNGRMDGVATDAWTEGQVDRGRDMTVDELLDRWSEQAPAIEGALDEIGPQGRQATFDIVTHEHDLRLALARPGARDSDAVTIGLTFGAPNFVANAAASGSPLGVRLGDGLEFGGDDAVAVLTVDPFTAIRALSGRRSLGQIRALPWEGDVEAVLPAFTWGPFRPSPDDIPE